MSTPQSIAGYALGNQHSSYGISKFMQKWAFILLGYILFLGIGFSYKPLMGFAMLGVLFSPLILVIAALGFTHRNNYFKIFDKGFMYQIRNKVGTHTWGDVLQIHTQVTQRSINFIPIGKTYIYTIYLKDKTKIVIDSNFKYHRKLAEEIEMELVHYQTQSR